MMTLTVVEPLEPVARATGATVSESAMAAMTARATRARRPHETPRRAGSPELVCMPSALRPLAQWSGDHPPLHRVVIEGASTITRLGYLCHGHRMGRSHQAPGTPGLRGSREVR